MYLCISHAPAYLDGMITKARGTITEATITAHGMIIEVHGMITDQAHVMSTEAVEVDILLI